MSDYETFVQWRGNRHTAVTSPTGNLALVQTRWDAPASEVDPDTLSDTQQLTAIQRTDPGTGETHHGYRVWDAASPAIAAFEQIDTYDYDPEWRLEATFTPVSDSRLIPFEHIRDNGATRDLVVPGDIDITIAGTACRLAAFDDGGTLLLVFGDPTNGAETYGSGRFLFVERDAGIPLGDTHTVILDFNRAFVPPCGFSAQYNCPLPPASNRISVPIRAGEKKVLFTGGFDIYSA